MRQFYSFAFLLIVMVASSCSKDVLKSYDRRILGTWVINDIDRYGFSGSANLPFKEGGRLTFTNDGQVTYTFNGATFKGSWDIRTESFDDETRRTLFLTIVDFDNQQVLSDYFNEMIFVSTNRFNAYIEYGSRTYVYRFKRM